MSLNFHHHLVPVTMTNAQSSSTTNQKVLFEQTPMDFDETNDQQTDLSISTTNRSIHLPVEKQRGISEIIRKRNSRYKVEDYKRSFQRSSTYDDSPSEVSRPISISKSDQALTKSFPSNSMSTSPNPTRRLTKTKSFDIPIEMENEENRRKQISMDKLNDLINKSSDEKSNEFVVSLEIFIEQSIDRFFLLLLLQFRPNGSDEKVDVAAKRNLFETFSREVHSGPPLTRSKSFKQETY